MFSFPAALVFGIVGIVCDRRKLLAIITTVIAAGLIVAWVCVIVITVTIQIASQ